jgi:PhoH-like ATPase
MKKTYVLDTNVFLTDTAALKAYGRNDIVIPTVVLDEIDKHKHRQDTAGLNARKINRILDKYRISGSLSKGVRISKGKGLIYVSAYEMQDIPIGFKAEDSDNKIIATALSLQRHGKKVILVSRDLNLRVKADSVGIKCQDYDLDKAVESPEELFSGLKIIEVTDEEVDKFYTGNLIVENDKSLCPNQFVVLQSNTNEKKTALCKFVGANEPVKKIIPYKDIWGVRARNKEQEFALDLLFDENVHIISLVGRAGSGKTLLSIAAGLEQVLNSQAHKKGYQKLIVTRPVQPMGRDIGFLPGTLEEKMMPWVAPIRDNLEHLFGDKAAMEMYMEQGIIEVEAMTYIRGRSISNAYIILDEAQNLTTHELKTIITRVGEGTKIILTGDIQQIDNSYVDATSNGLAYAVEKFKQYKISGHVTLSKGERSQLATLAAEIL